MLQEDFFLAKKGAEGFPESEGIFSQYVGDYVYVYVYFYLCPSQKISQYLILKRLTFVPFKKCSACRNNGTCRRKMQFLRLFVSSSLV